ncbi:DMT family transporter [Bacillus massiliigorillae]|uniref:DMT family transporter n=1 Tax=Bacillus massiliigorillae TaxID=1243664 RepID=UPI0003AAE24B|nr:DMT family transporter [Bacillus massiliigorillae]
MRKLQGIIYVIAAATFFGIMPIWVKLAYTTGLTAIDFTFFRSALAAVMLGLFICYRKMSFRVKKQQMAPVLVACTFFTATILILYMSYNYVSAGVATSLHYLFPVLVMLFAYVLYREKLQLYKWIAVFISLVGIYLIADPGGSSFSLIGVSLAILSAVFFAIYALVINHPEVKKLDSLVLAFYLCVFAFLTTLVLLIIQGNWLPTITLKGLGYTSLVSFFCTALSLIFFIKGAQSIGSANASILSTMEPVVSLVAGVIILNEPFTWYTSLGCIIIVSAIILIGFADVRKSSQSEKKLKNVS